MRVVCRIYKDGMTKPHIDEFKVDVRDEDEAEDEADSLREFLLEGLERWREIMEDGDEANG